MNSINRQQAEKNHEDLQGASAINKITELAEKSDTCFFGTYQLTDSRLHVRPMNVLKTDDAGNFWFLSAHDSHKNQELEVNPRVHLLFQGSSHSDYLSLHGVATISRDKERISELWNPLLKTWFTEGKDDPRITVIKVTPQEGYYWDNKHGSTIAFLKMAVGATIGKTLDDSIEGEVKP
ncbi:pyridoxamine 5'-phosphate oxidase family protein [Cesiribacter andamanensis]|uniref:Putative stress protein (General stress protein 26) n=1 Tax=Cesiribacter andamanensis AMV16 TaxID=1279009 RepID=M7NCB0_9BACT|nr:pyridoxamine 5'-phosphate oxidase family protein [Cesiribacter andamanensis]EMR04781.1 putative stress protein (general stress protein 26) [Cesiribacter andamanensis AMV16]